MSCEPSDSMFGTMFASGSTPATSWCCTTRDAEATMSSGADAAAQRMPRVVGMTVKACGGASMRLIKQKRALRCDGSVSDSQPTAELHEDANQECTL